MVALSDEISEMVIVCDVAFTFPRSNHTVLTDCGL